MNKVKFAGFSLSVWKKTFSSLAGKINEKAQPRWALAILSLWLMWQLAQLTWMLIPAPNQPQTSNFAQFLQASNSTANTATHVSNTQLVAQHLFGVFDAAEQQAKENQQPAQKPAVVNEDVPESTLQLVLRGVLTSSVDAAAQAIVEHNGRQAGYRLGDNLIEGQRVTLTAVLHDRILINNKGRAESILLYEENAFKQGANQAIFRPKPAFSQALPKNSAAANFRRQWSQNATSIAQLIKFTPERRGTKFKGFRILPGKDSRQFTRLGLKRNDLVTAVNGITLDNPRQAIQMISEIKKATELSLSITRGRDEINLSITLDGEI